LAHARDHVRDARQVLSVGDLHGYVDARKVPRVVGDDVDAAIGHGVNDAVVVADDGTAQRYALDGAGDVGDADDVAGPVLVLGQQEDAVDRIAHQRLSAKSERQAGDAEAGDDGGDVDADLVEDGDDADEQHSDTGSAFDDVDDGVGALVHLLVGRRSAAQDGRPRHPRKDSAEDDRRHDQDNDDDGDRGSVIFCDVVPTDCE